MNIHIIRTDGREVDVEGKYSAIGKLIGAVVLDSVNLRDGRVMLVDDLGYEVEQVEAGQQQTPYGMATVFERRPVRARKPVNPKATALYHAVCKPGTTHQIVGDVAIIVDAETSE